MVSGIVHVIRNGLRWRDAPAVFGFHKTLYNRFVRWFRMGIFDRIFANLVAESGPPDRAMMLDALTARGIVSSIPSKATRKIPIAHDRTLYRQRHKIENMFGKLKDWRHIHTRYERCAHTFFSAICIAATVIFWLGQWILSLALLWRINGLVNLIGEALRSDGSTSDGGLECGADGVVEAVR